MENLYLVIIFSLIGGVLSLVGGVFLLTRKKSAKLTGAATALAAGALLAAAFMDLIPEAVSKGDPHLVPLMILVGVLVFFILESSLHWFHHHSSHNTHKHDQTDPVVPLIVIGDTLHNAIDGIAIAAGFLIDPLSGIIITLAVAAHEIPQEIGDFGLLLHKGLKKSKVLIINALSALATTVSAVVFFLLGSSFEINLSPLLALIAGFFIYIALSDIIPGIHAEKKQKVLHSIILLAGVAFVGALIFTFQHFFE